MNSPKFWLRALPILIPFLILIGTGLRGIDFGYHWDEIPYQLKPVQQMAETGTFLPNFYLYPSVTYYLTLATVGLDFIREKVQGRVGIKDKIISDITSMKFLVRDRVWFLFLSSLSLFWVYFLVLFWRNSVFEAFTASCLLAFSWEVAYHCRWVAADALVMTFGAATLFFCILQFRTHDKKANTHKDWLTVAAVFAGIATGTKYPGALLLIVVWVSAWYDNRTIIRGFEGVQLLTKRWVKLGAIAFGIYLISTPGTFLQPKWFYYWVNYISDHYRNGPHWGYMTPSGIPHLARMVTYLFFVFYSHFTPLAVFLSVCTILGAIVLFREDRRFIVPSVTFIVCYLLYFSHQRVMIVRNLLVLAPFFVIMAAHGVSWIVYQFPLDLRKYAKAAFLLICIVPNAAWLFTTAETIHHRHDRDFVGEAATYINSHTDSAFLGKGLSAVFQNRGLKISHPSDNPETASEIVAFISDFENSPIDWPANRFHQFTRWFGPYDANLDYYPTWNNGDDRIVVLSSEQWRRSGMLLIRPSSGTKVSLLTP